RAFRHPGDPPLVPVDRWQYVSGWPAGGATERAVSWLRAEAGREPLIVLTGAISGNPGDSLWVLLRGQPGVSLYTTARYLDGPLLKPDAVGGVSLLGDFRAGEPERSVVLPKDLPVYFVATDPLATRSGWMPAGEFLKTRDPSIVEVWRSLNPA